ncbi:hypothetical protein HMPREF9520_02999 [Enterococcus faecalis TX1467]|nr:hypothetical protein HMPREF9520_02999 [Enterococcus faecalis TX1467]
MSSLINRKIPQGATANKEADTKRKVTIQKKSSKKILASERKNIKVSPSTFDLIKTISTMKSYKNYEFIDKAVESYIQNNLTEREQRILKNLISQ